MELSIAKPGNGAAGTVQVSDVTFAREFNEDLVHQVVVAYGWCASGYSCSKDTL